jgi:hypothetical protein
MAYIELFANLQEVGLRCHYPKQVVISDKVFYSEGVEAWRCHTTRLPIVIPPTQIILAMDAEITHLRMAELLVMISACANTSRIFIKL